MASHQPISKSTFSPAIVSSLPPQIAQAPPEISEESRESEQVDLRAQLERADRLGHNYKHISPIAGVPPMQTRPDPVSEDQAEEEWEEAPVQRKESASAAGDPSELGSSGSAPPPGAPSQGSGFGLGDGISLQAQFERAERLGHQFGRVSVLSDRGAPVRAHPLNSWVQRACAACQQDQEELGIQPQLTMGQPGDPYEVEADRVADQVMSMPEDQISMLSDDPQEQQWLQSKPLAETISRVQRSGEGSSPIGTDFESRLSSAKGGGSPLPGSVQSFMGSRLGADLSGVRVHTDAESVQMNREIGAQAFTHGEHVFYGEGKGPGNDHLTAHELTHTIQQGAVFRRFPQSQIQLQARIQKRLNVTSSRAPSQTESSPEAQEAFEETRQNAEPVQEQLPETSGYPGDTPQAQVSPDSQPASGSGTPELATSASLQGSDLDPESATAQSSTDSLQAAGDTAPTGGNSGSSPNASSTNSSSSSSPALADPQAGSQSQRSAPSLSGESPSQILEQLKNTPPTQAAAAFAQAGAASNQAWQTQSQQLQETLPELPAPTGLPPRQDPAEDLPTYSEQSTPTVDISLPAAGESSPPQIAPVVPDMPSGDVSLPPSQLTGGETVGEDGTPQADPELVESAQRELSFLGRLASQFPPPVTEPPSVDLSGEADPARMDAAQAEASQQIQQQRQQQIAEAQQRDFGEHNLFPDPTEATLSPQQQISAAPPSALPELEADVLPLPPDVSGNLDQSLTPMLRDQIAPEQSRYLEGKVQFDQDVQQTHTTSDEEIAALTTETQELQRQEQQQAQAEVSQGRQQWQAELEQADQDFQSQAHQATQGQRQRIEAERSRGQREVEAQFQQAEQQAEAEEHRAEERANREQRRAERESGGFRRWLRSRIRAFLDRVRSTIEGIYDAMRETVRSIMESAQQLAASVINAVRDTVVNLITELGNILQDLVNQVLAALPEIAQRIIAQVGQVIERAREAINAAVELLHQGITAALDALTNAINALLQGLQQLFDTVINAIGAIIDLIMVGLQGIGNLIEAATQMPDYFWGQLSEELLGADITQPLPFERTHCGGESGSSPEAGPSGDIDDLLSREWSAEDFEVEAVPFDLDPELIASLNLEEGGELEFGESDHPAASREGILAELMAQGSAGSMEVEDVEGAETTEAEPGVAEGGCPDAATVQAQLDELMSQPVENVEGGQSPGPAAQTGDIPEEMRTIGPLTPAQRAGYMFHQLRQGVQQWFAANWGLLLAGAIAAITGFIAVNIVTGGAAMAALPLLLQVMGTVMTGYSLAIIAGHFGNYLSQGWAGDIPGAATSLARGVAAAAFELVFELLFNIGAVIRAARQGARGAAMAAVGSVGNAVRTTARNTRQLGRIAAQGARTAVRNGKIAVRGLSRGFAQGAKSIDDLAGRLINRFRFNKFKIRQQGGRFQLWGHVNPWVLLTDAGLRRRDAPSSGKQWDDPSLTEDEFIQDYKARYPATSLSDSTLQQRFQAGQRLNPESGRLRSPVRPLEPTGVRDLPTEGEAFEVWQSYRRGDTSALPCFPAGTVIRTPEGNRSIESIQNGETVYAFDLKHNCLTKRLVTSTHKNWTQQLTVIETSVGKVTATGNHPFWVSDQNKWMPAKRLKKGMALRLMDGQLVIIESIDMLAAEEATYNIEVDKDHTYFSGEAGILVHNGGEESGFERLDTYFTEIYEIRDVNTGRVVYVGQSIQGVDTRMGQHVSDPSSALFVPEESPLRADPNFPRNVYQTTSVASGEWTRYEAAVWEQHYIDSNGGKGRLRNRQDAITQEKFTKYRNLHNPCI